MQTFLPYASFHRSAAILDRARLGKQRIEVVQLLKALHGAKGYANHPATIMWRGYDRALASYGLYICDEWINRGYRDTCRDFICDFFPFESPAELKIGPAELKRRRQLPWWFGWRAFHESHRSNLRRKDPIWYGPRIKEKINNGPFYRVIPDNLPYIWPFPERGKFKRQHSKDSIYYSAPPPRQKNP